MKKKTLIIIGIVIFILFITGLITSYKDSARVRNGIEPKYTIKVISNDGRKVTYWGLGYKVIRYVSVSPYEPYKSNIGVKYGSWFMKYELEEQDENNLSFVIMDELTEKQLTCASALEKFYEDELYIYYWSCIKDSHVIVKYNDGTTILVSEALKDKKINISDLDKNNIYYYKEVK